MGQARSFLTLGGSFFGNQRIVSWVGLCGIGPALAGNVGTGGAFALSREGDQGVDVPMLAPDLSRCRPGVLSGGGGSILRRNLRREMMDCVVGEGNSRRDRLRGLREELRAGKVGLEGRLRSRSPDDDHLRRCFGAGFEAFGRCSSGFDVVNGSVGMLFGRGCLRFGRSARL